MIFIATDILNPYKREILSQDNYNTLIDFLVEQFPDGFKRPTDISVNGHEVALADYDIELKEGDVVVILDRAALPVGLIGGWFITALANLAISVTLSYVANKLFAPDAPEDQGTPSSVYNLNSAQNAARYGSPIPIIYGKVRMYPSMIAQPFYRYENNIEYLYHVMCVGQGTNTTDKILIAEDEITSAGDLQWKLLYQSDFYNIPLKGLGYHITNTLETPSNMKLINDTSNPEYGESEKYRISKDASSIEFDYIYPQGLSWVKGDGSYTETYTALTYRIYTYNGSSYTQIDSGVAATNAYSIDAIQKTYTIDARGFTQDVYISFEKTYGANDSRTTNDTYIKRVKEIFPNEDFTQLYGDITLLVCKIKATNAVSSAGQLKVNGYFTRTDVGNTMAEVLTDIYTNTTYGGGLSADDLSFPVTTETVNCAYDSSMTIFDAMRRPALAQGYSLYLAGMDVILKKDGANDVTSAMYNEMNILRNSFKAQYLFKEEYPAYDGFKCTYIDGDGWIQRSETYPALSARPKTVDLFGVVDTGCVMGMNDGTSYVTGSQKVTMVEEINGRLWVGSHGSLRIIEKDGTVYKTITQYTPPGWVSSATNQFCLHFVQFGNKVMVWNIVRDSVDPRIGGILVYDLDGNYLEVFTLPTFWDWNTPIDVNVWNKFAYCGDIEADGSVIVMTSCGRRATYVGAFEHGAFWFDSSGNIVKSSRFEYTTIAEALDGITALDTKYLTNSHYETLYLRDKSTLAVTLDITAPCTTTQDWGQFVKYLPDANGTDYFCVTPGEPGYTNDCNNKSVFIYNLDGTLFSTLTVPAPGAGEVADYLSGFGANRAVSRYKDYVVVGAYNYGTNNSGKVYIYGMDGTLISEPGTSTLPVPGSTDNLGRGVYIDGTNAYMFSSELISTDYVKINDITCADDFSISSDMAKYLYKQEESRRKIVSFSTDIQGLVPQFLDKIMVSHNSLQWGEAGEVYDRTVDDLTISDALESLTGSKTIVFRNIDGSVSDPYSITITDATHITVTGMPAWVDDGTFYTIQEAGTAKEFLVIAVKPSGDTVQIDCVNYDETIYN